MNNPRRPIEFVPNKALAAEAVAPLLALSHARNHFTNFGPVSRLLEQEIVRLAATGGGREAAVACNATLALNAAAGVYAIEAGRPLRWLVSAFGFFATFIGPFADAIVVDCDEQGLLSLSALEQIPLEAYDGIVVTNPFGLHGDLSPYLAWADRHGKKLIVDNAAGLGALRWHDVVTDACIEVISLHHTKPFGFGEGGAALMTPARKRIFEGIINFGVGQPGAFRTYFTNGKLSDVAAAYILAHLRTIGDWKDEYCAQSARVIGIGRGLGLAPMALPTEHATPGQVALLARRAVSFEELTNDHLVMRKYYVPVAEGYPVSRGIYDCIINVPCHPEVARLSDHEIERCLAPYSR